MMVVTLHMRSLEKQSTHRPATAQGVDRPRRCAFFAQATAFILSMHSSMVSANLFLPIMSATFFGPNSMEATRLPVPSMFTILPVRVMPLAEAMNQSA